VQQGLAVGVADAGQVQLVDVALLELVHVEPHALAVLAELDLRDLRRRLIDLRAA